MTNEELDKRLGEVSDVREPERDLWPGVKGRIAKREILSYRTPLAMAAGAALVILGMGMGIFFSGYAPSQRDYLDHVLLMKKEYDRLKPLTFSHLPASERERAALIEGELDGLDETSDLLTELLKADPENPLIYTKAVELYGRKLRILQELRNVRLDRESI